MLRTVFLILVVCRPLFAQDSRISDDVYWAILLDAMNPLDVEMDQSVAMVAKTILLDSKGLDFSVVPKSEGINPETFTTLFQEGMCAISFVNSGVSPEKALGILHVYRDSMKSPLKIIDPAFMIARVFESSMPSSKEKSFYKYRLAKEILNQSEILFKAGFSTSDMFLTVGIDLGKISNVPLMDVSEYIPQSNAHSDLDFGSFRSPESKAIDEIIKFQSGI